VNPRYAALAVFAMVVIGFAIYLLIEVHATPAHAQSPDLAHPVKTSQVAPAETTPVATPPRAEPVVIDVSPRIDPQPPANVAHPLVASAHVAAPALPPDDPDRANPHLDSLMAEANKAYDRGDLDDARSQAEKIVATNPNNVRMLRIVVSVACLDGDQAAAQKAFDALPRPDKEQMKIRCARSGMTFNDPAAAAAAAGQ
jgi:hypothetical protein